MIDLLPYKTKQFLVVLIKLSIVVGAFYFIYHKVIENQNLDYHLFIEFLEVNDVFSLKTICLLLILTFFNWFFEIYKWRTLVSPVFPISYKNALEQSLGGLTASLMTPNRIGEYGAKAMWFPRQFRKKIVLLNLLGHMTQMTTTLIFGCIGLFFLVSRFALAINYPNFYIIILILILAVLVMIYLGSRKNFIVKGFPLKKIIKFIKKLPNRFHIKILMVSSIRYLIFSFQFYVLLLSFNIDITYFSAMMCITSMYLLSSIIPSILIFDAVIKGSVAVYIFSFLGINDTTILSIVMLMWILNFVIPSVLGSYFVLNFNLPKKQIIA